MPCTRRTGRRVTNREDTAATSAARRSLLLVVVLLLRVLLRRVLRLLLAGLLLLFRFSPSDSLLSFCRKDGGAEGDNDGGGAGSTGGSGGKGGGSINRPDEDSEGTEAARRRRPSAASSSSAWCWCMALRYRELLSLLISRCCGRLSLLPLSRIPFYPRIAPVVVNRRAWRECSVAMASEGCPSHTQASQASASPFRLPLCCPSWLHPLATYFSVVQL